MTNPTFDTFDKDYQRQVADYEAMIGTALATNDASRLPEIRAKAEQIQTTLNKMIESMTYLKKETPSIQIERDKLLEKLRRIQQDYNAMSVNTDNLETLRRIRQQENEESRRQLFRYIAFFLLLACVLLIFLIVAGPQKNASIASTPTMSPPLT